MKAVVTVIGRDSIGIIAEVSGICSKYGANIEDITQSVMQQYFTMIMLVDLERLTVEFSEFADVLAKHGQQKGLEIRAMHQGIFNAMHHI